MAQIPPDLEVDIDGENPDQAGDIKVVKDTILSLSDCDSTSGWTIVSGAGVQIVTATNYVKEGTASIRVMIPASITAIVKTSFSSQDISSYEYLKVWLRRNWATIGTITQYFGESTYNEQSSTADLTFVSQWEEKSFTLSSVTSGSQDAVKFWGIQVTNSSTSVGAYLYIDYVHADPGPSAIKAYDGSALISLYPKFQAGVYQSTGAATKTITLNKFGTPSCIKIQNCTTGDATANDEVTWYTGMTQYYSCRTGGAAAVSTDNIIDVGDGYFTVGAGNYVNENGKSYGYAVWWNDTTA